MIDNRIVLYEQSDRSVAILVPTEEALLFASIDQIARKDVPFNMPYWIVERDLLPVDRTFRDAWEIDESMGSPDGLGAESNEFDTETINNYMRIVLGIKIEGEFDGEDQS